MVFTLAAKCCSLLPKLGLNIFSLGINPKCDSMNCFAVLSEGDVNTTLLLFKSK